MIKNLRVPRKTIWQQALFAVFGVVAGAFLITNSFQEFIQVFSFALGVVFITIGMILVYSLITFPQYSIGDKFIEVKTLTKTTKIQLDNITEVRLFDHEKDFKLLTIKWNDREHGIASDQTLDFDFLLEHFKELIVDDEKAKGSFDKVIWVLAIVIVFPLFLTSVLILSSDKPRPESVSDLSEIEIILAEDPSTTGRKFSKNRKFVSTKDAEFSYLIDDDFLSRSQMKMLHEGDTLVLLINKYDDAVKLKRTAKSTWLDRHLDWNSIRIYGIAKGSTTVIEPESVL